jgi:hypothetical protein
VDWLREDYYESGNAPHEALGRAARKLMHGGALYLGAGVGVEKLRGANGTESYRVSKGSKSTDHPGPLSAAIRAFSMAGAATNPDTPGGATKVPDPGAAARLRELADEEASANSQIERYTRQLARRAKNPPAWSPGGISDDGWEQRRIDELRADIASIHAERAKLLAAGKVEEVEQARPGTNWTKVPAQNVKKLQPIIDHYRGMAHPFTACVRDQIKHGLSEDHANRRCAVVKDLGEKTTKWRKGGKGKVAEGLARALAEAAGRLTVIDEMLFAGAVVMLAEGGVVVPGALNAQLAEVVSADLGLLALAGHPIAQEAFGANPAVRAAVAGGGKAGSKPMRSPSLASFDKSKHPRGAKGNSAGGKFISKTAGTSTQVRTVQHHLGLATDGKFGAQTHEAVRRFQQRHGLVADGIVGRQTMAAFAGRKDAASVKPGSLSGADVRELTRIRTVQTRRRAQPRRGRGGLVV